MSSESALPRAFLAALPDAAARAQLSALQQVAQQALPELERGWTPAADLHLTLRFLGDLDQAAGSHWRDFVDARPRPAPFRLVFERLDYWPPRSARLLVACLAAEPSLSDWVTASEAQARRVGLASETRRYVPHVTLLRSGQRLQLRPAFKLAPFELGFDRLALMMRAAASTSAAPRYACFEQWRLIDG